MVHEGMVHEVNAGKAKRMSFSKIQEAIEIPDLIEIQKDSYARLLKYGLREVFDDISPITDYSETLALEFLNYRVLDSPNTTLRNARCGMSTMPRP